MQRWVTSGTLSDPDVVLHAARVSVWGRWFIWLVAVVELAYRPEFWYPEDAELLGLPVLLGTLNALVHHRILTHRPVTWRWLLFLSAAEIAMITAGVVIDGGYTSLIFLAYYPSLAVFAVVFSSHGLTLAWTTTVAAAYAVVCLTAAPGLDAGNEKVLLARLAMMFTLVLGISFIARFERIRWRSSVARERELRRERIELSQTIHDTSAQTAYMIGLGIHRARELAGESNQELSAALDATLELSMSAMWEMRGPIDAGHILEGRELGRVLWSHCSTFERITGVPTGMSQSGDRAPARHGDPDPPLLHRPQRADQRLPPRPTRQGRGQVELRGRPDHALRLGRRGGSSRRLCRPRRQRPGLDRHEVGRRADGRNAHGGER